MPKGKIIYCTYFDKGFLLKGLALHSSLVRHNPDAELWILTFDDYTEKILKKMKLRGVTVIPLRDFEDKGLLVAKKTRSNIEYMWTTTPSIPLYIFKHGSTDYVMYLDADEYFFSSANAIIDEVGNCSLLAIEHRFPKGREVLNHDLGRFNVAVNVFKKDKIGIACLTRWRKQCINWCYWKHEDGKLGDQMYLNEWPKLYGDKLVISKNLGVNAAPWNISQYSVSKKGTSIYVNDDKLVCYHFHQFQILTPEKFSRVHGYIVPKEVEDGIYTPYEKELTEQYKNLKRIDSHFEIKVPYQNPVQIFRQKLGKYLGPPYWKLKTLLYTSGLYK